jgi:hypothetical protein
MSATTKARNTKRLGANVAPNDFWIKGTTKINMGALACLNASGLLVPGTATTGLKAVGRARDTYDNTAGGDSAFKCAVESGTFLWNNSAAGDAIAIADLGADCYIVDDQTVAKTDGTGTRSKAGKIIDVVAAGVWVETRHTA